MSTTPPARQEQNEYSSTGIVRASRVKAGNDLEEFMTGFEQTPAD